MLLVNGRDEAVWSPGMTVADLLRQLRYSFPHIIVSIDGELVPREEYDTCPLADGASVQVFHLTAGG